MSAFLYLEPVSEAPEALAAATIANDTIARMEKAEFEPFRGAKDAYPAAWCERASVAIALAIEDAGLPPWDLVVMGIPDELSGHAWLELHQDGSESIAMDVTIHQRPEWDLPYLGPAPSPAIEVYSESRYFGPYSEWPVLKSDSSLLEYGTRIAALQ